MRSFSFSIRRDAAFTRDPRRPSEAYNPDAVQDRLNRSMRRRLADDLTHLIRRTILIGNVEAARGLLGVLREQVEREKHRFPHGRRPAHQAIDQLDAEIAAASQKHAA